MKSKTAISEEVSLCVRLMICLVLIALCTSLAQSKSYQRNKKNEHICYFVVSSRIIDDFGAKERQMFLLIEPNNFTESKLKNLARYFYKSYPDPKNLHISLYSHIDQLRDHILRIIEQTEPNEAFDKYPRGIILRANENEIIRYTHPPNREWKTIVLKGKD